MAVEIKLVGPDALGEYASVPIAFEVTSRFQVTGLEDGLGFRLVEESVDKPWVKDHDLLEGGTERPLSWPRRFDVSNWGIFIARDADVAVGGAVVAWRTPAVRMLDGRDDLAVLWDFRMAPDHRRSGIGTALFRRVADWAKERGCRQLKIETQDINVPACRFYEKQGCVLGGVNRFAYAGCREVADEVMLFWYLDLPGGGDE